MRRCGYQERHGRRVRRAFTLQLRAQPYATHRRLCRSCEGSGSHPKVNCERCGQTGMTTELYPNDREPLLREQKAKPLPSLLRPAVPAAAPPRCCGLPMHWNAKRGRYHCVKGCRRVPVDYVIDQDGQVTKT